MGYQAILFCADEKANRMVTQVLTELDFTVEPSNEPFATVKRLTTQHFSAVVVDCDDEQNAALLFKTARNSAPNKASLLVAVVEGQAGIAKAFRIGANLVLTKPINIEQSKGTLRVARGLLKKGEVPRTSTGTPASHETHPERAELNFGATRPPTPAPPQQKPVHIPVPFGAAPPPPTFSAGASSVLELEHEPGPQPDLADAAMLESLPEPISVQPPSSGVKAGAWQPVKSAHATSGLHLSSRGGEAAAPALIRETSHSNGEASAVKPHLETAVELPSRKREEAHKPVAVAQPVEEELSAPAFSTSKEAEPAPKSSHTGLILVLVLAVCAVGGYFGWTKFAAKPVVVPQQSAPEQVPPAAAVDGSSAAPAKPSAIITPAETPAPAQHDAGSAPEEEAAADVVVHNLAASKSGAAPPKEAAAPIVVKSSTPQPARLDTNAPAPQVTSMVSNSGDQAISGIVGMTTSVPKPVLQTVRVSQGISQGFLIKKVQPLYPVQARQLRLEGAVQLVATIGKDGVPKDLKVAGGHPVLARAAVEAVQQWRYKAYTLNGSPVEFETQVTVNFKLP